MTHWHWPKNTSKGTENCFFMKASENFRIAQEQTAKLLKMTYLHLHLAFHRILFFHCSDNS